MSKFRVIEHKIPAQHIREYPRATANSQEDILYLSVKQYIPRENINPNPGGVTIIGTHANGFPKELYEPFWDDLLEQSTRHGWRIRSIWMADVSHQGQSGVINEELLGNDPSWHDHARDLLHLINMKREEMPRPLIGVGHSMGGCQLAYLSLMHPRLLTSLVLLDPTIQTKSAGSDPASSPASGMAQLSTFRRTLWPSREAAALAFERSSFYKSWDRRVFQRWLDFGLRDTPTILHPDATRPQVTLTTTVAQEVFTYVRPNYDLYGVKGNAHDRNTHADLDPSKVSGHPFYRPEAPQVYDRLSELRPSVLYIFGGTSPIGTPQMNEEKLARTGTGVGGSGGPPDGRVKGITFEGVGHLVPMEAPSRTAEAVAEWVGEEVGHFWDEETKWREEWKPKTLEEKQEIDEKWKTMIGVAARRAKI